MLKQLFIFAAILANLACDEKGVKEKTENSPTYDLVVAKDGSGDYESVQEAFDAVEFNKKESTVIFVKNGTYEEVLTLPENKNNISIIGESENEVILTFDNYASKINPKTNEEYGTSGSSSTFIYGNGFYAENITFENSAGPVGQALAIYINGDKAVFVNCSFLGWQDTIYAGRSRQYFKNCYIEGSTDFIFGPSIAFFDNCELYAKGGSAITAASTEEYVDYGYVFRDSKITGKEDNNTTLGRPWRPFSAVTFINTEMSDSIQPRGWDNWGKEDNEKTARYAEYNSSGNGATPEKRVDWAVQLSETEVQEYSIENVLGRTYTNPPNTDNWDPRERIEKMRSFKRN